MRGEEAVFVAGESARAWDRSTGAFLFGDSVAGRFVQVKIAQTHDRGVVCEAVGLCG